MISRIRCASIYYSYVLSSPSTPAISCVRYLHRHIIRFPNHTRPPIGGPAERCHAGLVRAGSHRDVMSPNWNLNASHMSARLTSFDALLAGLYRRGNQKLLEMDGSRSSTEPPPRLVRSSSGTECVWQRMAVTTSYYSSSLLHI